VTKSLAILFILFPFFSIAQYNEDTDLGYYGFKNGVAKAKINTFSQDTISIKRSFIREFDKLEFQISEKDLSINDSSDVPSWTNKHVYSRNHLKGEGTEYSYKELVGKTSSKFDKSGRIIEHARFDVNKGEPKLYERTITTYFKDSTVIKDYGNLKELKKTLTIYFDLDGTEIGRRAVGITPRVHSRSVYSFDEDGRKVKSISFRGERFDKFTLFVYEVESKLELDSVSGFETYNADSTLEFKIISGYNEKGDEVYHYSYNIYGGHVRQSYFKYIYDEKGNWIRREKYNEDNKFSGLTKRELTYHL
jgi:hypothetical protein